MATTTRSGVVLSLGAAILIAGCASRDVRPANIDDICSIYAANPHWGEAAARAEARWGAPQEVKMAIIWRESAFDSEARPPRTYVLGFVPTGRQSSAYGYPQAIDGTWEWYRRETGARGADRNDFEDAIDFVGWYMEKTRRSNGLSLGDAYSQYLAYHEGHAGYRRGGWRSKAWLRRAAASVARQAERYRGQLGRCGRPRA